MIKVTGLVNLHNSSKIGDLNAQRTVASTSFLGRYAFMDFTLSNFANSGIDDIGILAKEHVRSLIQHISYGHPWNDNTKLGGLALLYDEPHGNMEGYNHDINNLLENFWFLKRSTADVVVIAPAHIIYRLDFRPLIEEHVKNNNKITLVYHKLHNARQEFIGEDVCTIDENGLLEDLNTNQGKDDEVDISLQTYIIDKEVLKGLLQVGSKTSSFYNLRDTIKLLCKDMPIHTVEHEGYVRCFDSLTHYLSQSIELLDRDTRSQLFDEDWDIYTKTYDTPPAKYGINSDISNSFISNGCQVEGTVKNSILSRDVIVSKGAVIENSVILSGTYISEDTHLSNVVVDKEARLLHSKDLRGTKENPLLIKRGDIV